MYARKKTKKLLTNSQSGMLAKPGGDFWYSLSESLEKFKE